MGEQLGYRLTDNSADLVVLERLVALDLVRQARSLARLALFAVHPLLVNLNWVSGEVEVVGLEDLHH